MQWPLHTGANPKSVRTVPLICPKTVIVPVPQYMREFNHQPKPLPCGYEPSKRKKQKNIVNAYQAFQV